MLRQIRTFQERGWAISIVGFSGRARVPASWDFHDLTPPAEPASTLTSPKQVDTKSAAHAANHNRSMLVRLALFSYWRMLYPLIRFVTAIWAQAGWIRYRAGLPPKAEAASEHVVRPLIETLYDLDQPRRLNSNEAHEIFYSARENVYFREVLAPVILRADLIVAHDYMTLPFAKQLAESMNAPFAVDIHEYAVEQYHFEPGSQDERYFSRVTRPMIEALHEEHFPKAHALSAVCDGISRQLQSDHTLPELPVTVRSTPFYSKQPFRPTGETIEVMYHGLVNSSRHLEVGIRSLRLWRPEFRFTIRGPGPKDYSDKLKALARELGVENRVSIEPSVGFDQIIATANRSDVGYLALMNYSLQRQFTSPNKFFEYIMAGLALAVIDAPELAPTVRQNGIGRLIEEFTPESIAATINSFDRDGIDAAKQASLQLARELCWEREQDRLVAAYDLEGLEARATNNTKVWSKS